MSGPLAGSDSNRVHFYFIQLIPPRHCRQQVYLHLLRETGILDWKDELKKLCAFNRDVSEFVQRRSDLPGPVGVGNDPGGKENVRIVGRPRAGNLLKARPETSLIANVLCWRGTRRKKSLSQAEKPCAKNYPAWRKKS